MVCGYVILKDRKVRLVNVNRSSQSCLTW